MYFEASSVYAPGEPRGDVSESSFQDVGWLGRYHFDKLQPPSILVAVGVLALIAYLMHRRARR